MKEAQLISSHDASSSFTSVAYSLGDLREYSIEVSFSSATLNGSLALEASNTKTNWVQITESVQTVTSGASHLWTVMGAGYAHVRVAWTRTSGTGTASANLILKEFPVIRG